MIGSISVPGSPVPTARGDDTDTESTYVSASEPVQELTCAMAMPSGSVRKEFGSHSSFKATTPARACTPVERQKRQTLGAQDAVRSHRGGQSVQA